MKGKLKDKKGSLNALEKWEQTNAFPPLNNSYSISVQLRRAKRDNLCTTSKREREWNVENGNDTTSNLNYWKTPANSSSSNVRQNTKARTIRAPASSDDGERELLLLWNAFTLDSLMRWQIIRFIVKSSSSSSVTRAVHTKDDARPRNSLSSHCYFWQFVELANSFFLCMLTLPLDRTIHLAPAESVSLSCVRARSISETPWWLHGGSLWAGEEWRKIKKVGKRTTNYRHNDRCV